MVDFNRLDELLSQKGISKTHLCNLIGKERYYIRDAKSKNVDVPEEYIEIWANALNSTSAYLKGETDQKEKTAETDSLSPIKQKILNTCSNLSEKELDDVLDYIEYKISQRKR